MNWQFMTAETRTHLPAVNVTDDPSAPDRAALLLQLEKSFESSQAALLARDLNSIRELTEEQSSLLRSMTVCKPASDEDSQSQDLQNQDSQATAIRILQLGRVHLAILRRAQQSLRVIANFLAGTQSIYEAHSGSFDRRAQQSRGSSEV